MSASFERRGRLVYQLPQVRVDLLDDIIGFHAFDVLFAKSALGLPRCRRTVVGYQICGIVECLVSAAVRDVILVAEAVGDDGNCPCPNGFADTNPEKFVICSGDYHVHLCEQTPVIVHVIGESVMHDVLLVPIVNFF